MKAFQIQVTQNSNFPIAILTFDLEGEKINKITPEVGKEFEKIVKDLSKTPQIKGMVLVSQKPDTFIAGADIHEIASVRSAQEGTAKSSDAQRLPTLIESLPFPTVAAVHGVCLGGGCELILGFTYRIATDHPKTQIGLPEVSLGILPGMGGCVRLPKIVGLQAALDMILGAKVWPAKKCLKTGLIHEMVPQALLLSRAIQVLEQGVWKKTKRPSFSPVTFLLEKNRLGRHMVYKKAKDMILSRTRGHYPAPLKALDVIYECLDRGLTDSLKIEAEGFGQLAETEVSKNLIGLFFQREAAKKQTGVADSALRPKKINAAAVIGAGAMGAGIAQLLSYKDISVRLKDVNEEAIAKGLKYSRKLYQELVDRKRLTSRELEQKMSWIGPATDLSGFKRIDMVIEAIVEDLGVKQKLFETLEAKVPHDAILATNTSSLSISEIAAHCDGKDRVIGLHFFNPVHKMPLVEIVVAPETSGSTIVTTVEFAKTLGKVPVVVKNSAGFLVNRILMPYMNEAAYLLEEGISASTIDEVMLDFGMPMGPFTLMDAVGIDICQKVAHILYQAFGDRLKPHTILDRVVEAGYLGNKNGKGFYKGTGKNKKENSQIYSVIGAHPKPQEYISEEWQNRMVFQMINEACLCLGDGVVHSGSDLDMAMIFGIGFPPFRGGLLRYAQKLGAQKVYSELDILQRRYGARFMPAPYLKKLVEAGRKFYES